VTPVPVVQTFHLGKTFNRRAALTDVSIELPGEAFHVVLGPNGAGKSTLIKIMMRQLVPSRGDCIVLGHSVLRDRAAFGRDVSYISEEIAINLPMTLRELGVLNSKFYGSWDLARFNQLCDEFGLDQVKRFDELSRGQKVRFYLSLALARHPKILLLDEITAALDALGRAQVYSCLGAYAKSGGTVIMATNIPADIQVVDGHIVYIDSGMVRINRPLASVSQNLSKLRLKQGDSHDLFNHPESIAVSMNADGSTSYLIKRELVPEGFSYLDRRSLTVEELVVYLLRSSGGGDS
jgi:ABC-2 type transport system ATP-binding protein